MEAIPASDRAAAVLALWRFAILATLRCPTLREVTGSVADWMLVKIQHGDSNEMEFA